MDEPDLDVSANVAGPSDLEARSGTGLDAAEQAGAGEIREGGDAEMDDARSDGGAEEGGNDELQNEKGEDMEDFETLEEKGSGNRDGEVVNADSEALEAEPDYEEKEKDWDADIEDEDIGAYAENEEEGVERREAAGHVLDGVAEAHAEEQAGEEAGLEGEEGGNAAGTGEGHMEGAQKAEITLPLARVKRIVKLDPDIKQVSSDALKTIALATELFLGSLAESTAHVTCAGKRSMVKVEDLLQTIKSRRRYKECLGTDLEYLRPVDANQAARQEARQAKAKEKAARDLPPGVKPITNFFKK